MLAFPPKESFWQNPTGFGPEFRVNFRRDFYKLLPQVSQTFAVAFTNFCCVVHKLLPALSQTFAALFTNFCRNFYKLLPRGSQTFAVTFTNFWHRFLKLLPWLLQTFAVTFINFATLFANLCRVVHKYKNFCFYFLVVHKLFDAMFTETFAVRAFVVMLL